MQKNHAYARDTEMVTSGSVNVYDVKFEFDKAWDGLTRIAVFRAGSVMIQVQLTDTNLTTMPWEVMVEPNLVLYVGAYGINCDTGQIVLPTVWVSVGTIQVGVVTTLGGQYMPCDAIIDIRYRINAFTQKLDAQVKDYLDPAIVYRLIDTTFGDMHAFLLNRIFYLGYLTEPQARELIRWNIPDESVVNEMIERVVGPSLSATMEEVEEMIRLQLDVDGYIREQLIAGQYLSESDIPPLLAYNIPDEEHAQAMIEKAVGPNIGMTQEEVDSMIASANDELNAEINDFFESGDYMDEAETTALLNQYATEPPVTEQDVKDMLAAVIGGSSSRKENRNDNQTIRTRVQRRR